MHPQQKLLNAIATHDLPLAKAAVADGADLEYHYPDVNFSDDLFGNFYFNQTALSLAIATHSEKIAVYLASHMPDSIHNLQTFENDTYLHLAAQYGMVELILHIAKAGGNLDIALADYEAPLDRALSNNQPAAFIALLEQGASPHKARNILLLGITSELRNWDECLQSLFDHGEHIRAAGPNGLQLNRLEHKPKEMCLQYLRDVDKLMECKEGEGADHFKLLENGRAAKKLNHILGADKLPDLFSLKRWQGREQEALDLYKAIEPAIDPYYRSQYDMLDMSAIR